MNFAEILFKLRLQKKHGTAYLPDEYVRLYEEVKQKLDKIGFDDDGTFTMSKYENKILKKLGEESDKRCDDYIKGFKKGYGDCYKNIKTIIEYCIIEEVNEMNKEDHKK